MSHNSVYDKLMQAVEQKKARIEHKEHFSMVYFQNGMKAYQVLGDVELQEYWQHLEAIRNYSVTDKRRGAPQKVPAPEPVTLQRKLEYIQSRMVFAAAS